MTRCSIGGYERNGIQVFPRWPRPGLDRRVPKDFFRPELLARLLPFGINKHSFDAAAMVSGSMMKFQELMRPNPGLGRVSRIAMLRTTFQTRLPSARNRQFPHQLSGFGWGTSAGDCRMSPGPTKGRRKMSPFASAF